MIKSGQWIIKQAEANGLITPFVPHQVRKESGGKRVVSYGCGSFGYDLRMSPKDFSIFRHLPGSIVDPKDFDSRFLESQKINSDGSGDYFILPGHSYGLCVSLEHIAIPEDVSALFIGKSTYARVGLIVNMTPGEAGWRGHLTIELSNSSSADIKVYANEGICQALFFQGEEAADIVYNRRRKYQDQPERVVTARM